MGGITLRARRKGRWRLSAAAVLAALLHLSACGTAEREEPAGPRDWVNPDVGSVSAPLAVAAAQLPYQGAVTEGIHYLVVTGLPRDTPYYVALTGKSADADLFVLSDAAFADYQCSSVQGGAADDQCTTRPLADDALYVEVYGYTGNDTRFILDVR